MTSVKIDNKNITSVPLKENGTMRSREVDSKRKLDPGKREPTKHTARKNTP